MTRRRRRLLLLLLLLLVAGYFVLGLPEWSATLVARGLSASFSRPVSVGAVGFRLVPLEIELRELQVASLEPGDPPTIEVPRIVITPSLAPLRGRRLVLSRVTLEEPRIRIHAFPDPPKGRGGDDIPRLGGGGGSRRGLDVSIGRLVIQGGEFRLDHDRVPLDIDLPDFRGRLQGRPDGGLQGRVSFGPGPLRFGTAPELPIGTDIDLSYHRGLLSVESARLYGEGTDLAYTGRLRFSGRPQGQFNLKGPVDLRLLDKHVLRSGFGLEGASRFDGVLSVDGSRLRIEGRMDGTVGRFLGEDVPSYAGDVSYDGTSGLRLRGLNLESLGGRGTLDVDVPPAPRPVRIRGPLTAVDGEGLVRLVFGWGAFGVSTAATGEIDVSWPKGQTRRISGSVLLDLAPGDDARTPLSGRFEWTAQDGVQTVKKADLRTPEARALLEGRVDAQDRTNLAVTADSSDLAATDDLLTRLRQALGNTEAQKAGFSGDGSFQGRWLGTLDAPIFEGRSFGRNVGYRGVDWGRAEWVGSADPAEVRSHSLVVRRGGAEMWLDGRVQTGYFGQDDAMDVKMRLKGWPAADIVKAMEWDLDVTGSLSGEASARGRRSAPEGEARVTSRGGRYYGVEYDEAEVASRWGGRTTEVTSGRASLGGGSLVFRGSLTDDGVYDGEAEVRSVELDAVATPLPPDVGLHGRLSGRVLLQGTLFRPRLTGTLRAPPRLLRRRRGGRAGGERAGHGRRTGRPAGPLPLLARGPRPLRKGGSDGALRGLAHPARAGHEPRPLPARARPRGGADRAGARGHGRGDAPGTRPRLRTALRASEPGAGAGAAPGVRAQEPRAPGPRRGRGEAEPPAPAVLGGGDGARDGRRRATSWARARSPSPSAGAPTCARSASCRAACAGADRRDWLWASPVRGGSRDSRERSPSRGPVSACADFPTASRTFGVWCVSTRRPRISRTFAGTSPEERSRSVAR